VFTAIAATTSSVAMRATLDRSGIRILQQGNQTPEAGNQQQE
jgi:hypothetical protein